MTPTSPTPPSLPVEGPSHDEIRAMLKGKQYSDLTPLERRLVARLPIYPPRPSREDWIRERACHKCAHHFLGFCRRPVVDVVSGKTHPLNSKCRTERAPAKTVWDANNRCCPSGANFKARATELARRIEGET